MPSRNFIAGSLKGYQEDGRNSKSKQQRRTRSTLLNAWERLQGEDGDIDPAWRSMIEKKRKRLKL
jgi:hypothetical protein